MSITARHKKPGGFRKLVNSLETTAPEKRVKILDAMRAEDADFTSEVEGCIFHFEEFVNVPDMIVGEIIGCFAQEMRTVALALFHCKDENLLQKFRKNMRPAEAREFEDYIDALGQVRQNEQVGARYRIIMKSREMEKENRFTLKKYSPNYRDE